MLGLFAVKDVVQFQTDLQDMTGLPTEAVEMMGSSLVLELHVGMEDLLA